METTLQDSLLKAISTVVDTRINDLALDKTVVCIIDKVLDSTKGSYRVKYNGGTFTAFSRNNDEIYQKGMAVLVQIPQNNMSNEKNIISRAWVNRSDIEDGVISPYLKNYVPVGNNVVIDKNGGNRWSLCSFHPTDNTCEIEEHGFQEIYKDDGGKKHLGSIDIKTQDLNVYLKNAVGLLVQANFSTNFEDENQENSSGNYGLCIKILKKSPYEQENYGKVLDSYKGQVIGKYLDSEASSSVDAEQEVKLEKYIDELESALAGNYKSTITINEETKEQIKIVGEIGYIDQKINEIKNLLSFYATENESIYKDIKLNIESYLMMLEEIRDNEDESLTGNYFYINYIYKWRKTVIEGSEETYYLSSSEMTGNPYNFSESQQYIIIPATLNTFDRIESITFYKENFLEDITKEKPDIFVNNIEIFALEENLESNGGYQLKLTAKDGLIFDINDSEETVKNITAKVTKLYYEDLTNDTTFYWFKKSSKVKDSTHEKYHQLGGLGWEIIKKNEIIYSEHNYPIHMSDLGLVAYDNVFKVVAKVNEEITLSQEFSIYNNKFKTNYRLVCSPGVDLISGDEATVSILIESKVGNEIKEIENLYLHDDNETNSEWLNISDATNNNQLTEYQYVWNLNKNNVNFEYKMANQNNNDHTKIEIEENEKYATSIYFNSINNLINTENSSAEISCTINKFVPSINDYSELGTATITLYRNSEGIAVSDYRIEIENGDQIFQYDEYGDAPNSDKLTNPIKIKSLIPHVYNRAGREINSGSYSVAWSVPTEKTLITTKYPEEPKNGKKEVVIRQCEFDISPYYYSDYIENQINCTIQFTSDDLKTEKPFYQRTNFLFTKIGNINTNGTEIVARITPIETRLPSYWNEPLTLYRYYEKNEKNKDVQILRFNMGAQSRVVLSQDTTSNANTINLVDNILKVQLFESNELIYDSVLDSLKNEAELAWSIVGGSDSSKHIKFDENGMPVWKDSIDEKGLDNYILKATVNYNGKNYYAFYPIYYIEYNNNKSKSIFKDFITINNQKLLKEIIYNSQGLNPTYDPSKDEKGIYLTFKNFYSNDSGLTQEQRNNITITWEAIGSKILEGGKTSAFFSIPDEPPSKIIQEGDDGVVSIKVKPDSQYIGGCGDNVVKATIKSGNSVLVTIYIPIYMGLNRFELESLNDWDGNSVIVDPDSHTEILAPQIGAGKKDANNRFTGILMGQKNTYNYNDSGRRQTTDSYTGLFGYRDGLQSIFLDAETGNAIFGLPEGYTLNNNNGIISENTTDDYSEGRIEIRPGGISTVGGWRIGRKSLYYALDNKNEVPTELEFSDNNNKDHFKHNLRGILLESGKRPRIIIKSREWTSEDVGTKNSEYDVAAEATSFELNIDPNKRDFFNLYRHYLQGNEWKVQPLVGIDANGKFFTNSLQDKASNLSLGPVSAFHHKASAEKYFGLNLISSNKVLFKAFVQINDDDNEIKSDSILHIAGGSYNINNNNTVDDYKRPIHIHGDEISLYAGNYIEDNPLVSSSFINISKEQTLINIKEDVVLELKEQNIKKTNNSKLWTKTPFNLLSDDQIQIIANNEKGDAEKNYIKLGAAHADGINLYGGKLIGNLTNEIKFDNKTFVDFTITNNSTKNQHFMIHQIKDDKKKVDGIDTDINVFELLLNKDTGKIHLGDDDNMHLFELNTKSMNKWITNQGIFINSNNGSDLLNSVYIKGTRVHTNREILGGFSEDNSNQIAIVAEAATNGDATSRNKTALYLNASNSKSDKDTLYSSLGNKEIAHPLLFYVGGSTYPTTCASIDLQVVNKNNILKNTLQFTNMNLYVYNRGIQISGHYDELALPGEDKAPKYISKDPENENQEKEFNHFYDIRLDATGVRDQGEGIEINAGRYRYGAIRSDISLANYFKGHDQSATFEGKLFKGYNNGINDHTAMFEGNEFKGVTFKGWGDTGSNSAKYEGNEFKGVTFKGWGDTGSNSAKYEGNEFKGVTFKGWDTNTSSNNFNAGTAKYYGANFYGGKFIGDGSEVTKTADSAGLSQNVSVSGVGDTLTVTIPTVTLSNGRPQVGSYQLTIKMPTIDQIKTALGNTYAPYGHDHTASSSKMYYATTSFKDKDGNNVTAVTGIGSQFSTHDITPTITVNANTSSNNNS